MLLDTLRYTLHPVIRPNTILSQLDDKFKGVKTVIDIYRVVQPYFLSTSTKFELRDEANKFTLSFSDCHHCFNHSCYQSEVFQMKIRVKLRVYIFLIENFLSLNIPKYHH